MGFDQSFIANLLAGYKRMWAGGGELTKRNVLRFFGATVTDNPNYVDPTTGTLIGATDVTFTAAGQYAGSITAGTNNNVVTNGQNSVRLTMSGGPGPATITGFAWTASNPGAGQLLEVINTSSQPVTFPHLSAGSSAPNQISIGSGKSVTVAPFSTTRFVYDGTSFVWKLQTSGLARPDAFNVVDYLAKGDGQRVTDATITNGQTAVHSNTATFTSADQGKSFLFYSAGAAGGTLAGTITTVNGPHDVVVSVAASATIAAGVFRWGTDNYNAIIACLNAAVAPGPDTGGAAPLAKVFFHPGDYFCSQTINLTPAYNGLTVKGASFGKAGPQPTPTVKLTHCTPGTTHILNTAEAIVVEDIWIDGGRCAPRVIDFEYFADNQVWTRCIFDGASPSTGITHYYGKDNGTLEIDNLEFYHCWLMSDLWDATYGVFAMIRNDNGEAFQIDYHEGWFGAGTSTYGIYLNAGSVNLDGTQVYGWTADFLHISGPCAYAELHNVYTEGTGGNFINAVDNGSGLSTDSCVVLDRCHINTVSNIVWACTQPLVLRNTEMGGTITVNLGISALGEAYTYRPVICENLRFVLPGASFALAGGATFGQHVIGSWYEINNGTGTLISDGGMTASGTALTSSGNHLTTQVPGLLVSVPGAGPNLSGTVAVSNSVNPNVINFSVAQTLPAGTQLMFASQANTPYTLLNAIQASTTATLTANYTGTSNAATTGAQALLTRIQSYQSNGSVTVKDAASNTVSGQVVTFTALPVTTTMVAGHTGVVVGSGYDVNGWQLAGSCYVVPPGFGIQIISADTHEIATLTANRAYVLSGNSALIGMRMRVSRVPATDAFTATITYNVSTPTTVALAAGQWAEFEYVVNFGWMLMEAGSYYPQGFTPPIQTGKLTLSAGTKTISSGITITANSQVHFTMLAPSGAFNSTFNVGTLWYQALTANMIVGGPGTGAFVVAATKGDGTVNSSDVSTLGYTIYN